jgi:hypothetical protein
MISHALFAAYSKERNGESVTLITDEYFHENLLNRRLTRGVQRIHRTSSAAIESAIELHLPKPKGTIEDFLEKRNKHQKEFKKLREYVIEAAYSSSTSASDWTEIDRKIKALSNVILEEENHTQPVRLYEVTRDKGGTAIGAYTSTALFAPETIRLSRSPSPAYGIITTEDTPLSRDVVPEVAHMPLPRTSLASVLTPP